jgi:hypothetical protein
MKVVNSFIDDSFSIIIIANETFKQKKLCQCKMLKLKHQKVMEITSFLTDEKKSTQQHRI